MPDRARTLVLYASGMPRLRRIFADTVRRLTPFPRARDDAKSVNRYVRFLWAEEYESLSYVVDWLDAFMASSQLEAEACNVNDLLAYANALRRVRDYELIVVLHSAAGDSLRQLERGASRLARRRCRLLAMIGNEFDLMSQKRAFLDQVGAEFVASQLPLSSANWLYEGCRARVLLAPAALNTLVYRPLGVERDLDIGFRGDRYLSPLIGDEDRARIIDFFTHQGRASGLTVDIEYARLPREDWNAFLNRCKGTIGAESGTHYLERDDLTRTNVSEFLLTHPSATFREIFDRFYSRLTPAVSGKAISSRHFEAVGAQTCQILVEGKYNGILSPNEHYIPVRSDLSNVDEAIARFRDASERARIVALAYEHVLTSHTYAHRVQHLLNDLLS